MWLSGFDAQSQDVWPKQAQATQRPLLANSQRVRAHIGCKHTGSLHLDASTHGGVPVTDADLRQEETVLRGRPAVLGKTHACRGGDVLVPKLDHEAEE